MTALVVLVTILAPLAAWALTAWSLPGGDLS